MEVGVESASSTTCGVRLARIQDRCDKGQRDASKQLLRTDALDSQQDPICVWADVGCLCIGRSGHHRSAE